MKNRGFTIIELMIVVSVIALLSVIAIPAVLRARMVANESVAQANLKTLAVAAETFSAANSGTYPAARDELTGYAASTPDFCADVAGGTTSRQGYNYSCTSAAGGYTFTAEATNCNFTGTRDFTITTGSILTQSPCS
jgi:prepilin-type N-terminal cleavage/methylation domain-containing protein